MNSVSQCAFSPQEKEALVAFKQKLKAKFGDHLITVKVFGSRARGDVHPDSDIDLLVIFKTLTKPIEDQLLEIICDILNLYDVYFEVVSYGEQEYERSKREQWPFSINLEKDAVAA